jgi:arginyl-tRNA synthetase
MTTVAPPLLPLLAERVRAAVATAFGPEVSAPEPLVLPARDPRHGDYATNAAMALARVLRQPPPALASQLAQALDVADLCEPPTVAGGFVNLRLRPDWLGGRVAALLGDDRAGLEPVATPVRAIVDYSGPNVAKEMHVGHLRSTIIGDCLANVLEGQGHDVLRINHVGDWGTQFGILIAHLEEVRPEGQPEMTELLDLYREANRRADEDAAFRERARSRVVDLQSGEATARDRWSIMVAASRTANDVVYDLLRVHGLEERGESSYAGDLAAVVEELEAKGLVVVDDGAKCVYVEGFANKEGEPLPLIVQKADGGYNYATSDLAALRRRVQDERARVVLYVVDQSQSQHLEMVFAVGRMAGWVPDDVAVRHVPFGLVLGEDGKRLRTRSGDNVRLLDLLEEAVDRARTFVVARAEERGEPVPDDLEAVARAIGIGALKYADLSTSRTSGYVFSFDRMLSLKGNTAPYLQYAHARMRSILREGGEPPAGTEVVLTEEPGLDLARRLVGLPDAVDRVVADDAPNHLCAALHDLASSFNTFYERCPVLRAAEPARTSRLALCGASARVLAVGLDLLGIEAPERL